jgi:hypothetical protein
MEVNFDRPDYIPLQVKLTLSKTRPTTEIDKNYIISQIMQNIFYRINQTAVSHDFIDFVAPIIKGWSINSCDLSNDGTNWFKFIRPATYQNKFILSESNISIITD